MSTLPHHDNAEKGILDPSTNKPQLIADEKQSLAPKPPKRKVSKWILWKLWFNTYRKFFTFVMTLNLTGVVLAATGHFPYARKYTGALVLGNLYFAILMRNELFGRFLYLIVNTLFAKWPPLWWRLGCTSVLQHLGGIHSGCATSGFIWLIFKVTEVIIDRANNHEATIVMGVVTNVLILISVLSAFPWIRNNFHNVFERHHRFIGWLGLISTWVFVLLSDSYDPVTRRWDPSGRIIIGDQQFWFAIGMTTFIVIPWITVREVPVDIELPSPKVAIIRFKRGMQQGVLGRISRSSIMEYHAFGIISEGTHAKYHYMICGVQGDFTRSLVNDPPRTLWTRTGLGAALSTCLQSPNWYLIWIGSDQEKTFGPTISGLIHRHMGPERLCLWDSKQRGGRPDVMKLVKEAYAYWKAEVVFITSNYQGNSEIMQGCKEAGIPAFGTLWDF
ncbi:hypothetical protein BU17DRAFT_74410 [Hysterangium stoloniferum]|nr:hypothetical protein BU17DRAFT_74410 [Hysterangium stoloniferum]